MNWATVEIVEEVRGSLRVAGDYLTEMMSAIPVVETREKAKLLDLYRGTQDDEVAQEYFNQCEAIERHRHSLTQLLTHSVLTHIHSLLEVHLNRLARHCQTERQIPLGVSDVCGKRIERAKVYFTRMVGIPLGNDRSWSTLRDLAMLRNRVVHEGARFENKHEELKSLMQRYPSQITLTTWQELDRDKCLVIEPSLCERFVKEIAEFFERLFIALGMKGFSEEFDTIWKQRNKP